MRNLNKSQQIELMIFVEEKTDSPDYDGCGGRPTLICEWLKENVPEELHAAVLDELWERNIICDCDLLYYGLK